MSEAAPVEPDLWVFAYGSLIWNPGFVYESREAARLEGYHRRYCIRSTVYRGTPERPGLVLGLEAGGACEGVAYRVAGALREPTLAYLRARELISLVYHERFLRVETRDGAGHDALTYVADPTHEEYARVSDFDAMVETIAGAAGQSGPNAEYALNTCANLSALSIHDPLIAQVAEALRRRG